MSKFTRLIRFIANNGKTYYGDAILPANEINAAVARQARIITGDIFGSYQITDEVQPVKRLLAPIAPESVRTVRCLGLNYEQHANESNMPIPKYPVLFYKPATSLAAHLDPIPVHPLFYEKNPESLDYECELVVVISKTGSNIPASQALNHVLGYAIGNDISHRDWQMNGGAGQWSHGKGADGWAPYGPAIVSPDIITDPQTLAIKTFVNGKIRQDSSTADMIFGVKEMIEFLSKGTTLMAGDVIFTGTPQGVAMGMKPKPVWLKDGDEVEVSLEKVGSIKNTVKFLRGLGSAKL